MEKLVDARGLACPLPVVEAKKASETITVGDTLTVLVDNEIAVQNLTRFATYKGFSVSSEKKADTEYVVCMKMVENLKTTKNVDSNLESTSDEIACTPDMRKQGLVVVLSSNVMGHGDEKLGTSLMKAFVFALTKQDVLPEKILCYNSGAYLSCEGADTLADLQALEAEGVAIYTCGTCLDYYGIKDTLAVGNVTNMYEIVEMMEQATKLIRP